MLLPSVTDVLTDQKLLAGAISLALATIYTAFNLSKAKVLIALYMLAGVFSLIDATTYLTLNNNWRFFGITIKLNLLFLIPFMVYIWIYRNETVEFIRNAINADNSEAYARDVNTYEQKFAAYSNEQLEKYVSNSNKYKPEVVAAARKLLSQRQKAPNL